MYLKLICTNNEFLGGSPNAASASPSRFAATTRESIGQRPSTFLHSLPRHREILQHVTKKKS